MGCVLFLRLLFGRPLCSCVVVYEARDKHGCQLQGWGGAELALHPQQLITR